MKAGLKFADRITTVSPTYAREIATHEFGCGLDGVIRGRGADVSRHPQRHRRRGLEPGHRHRARRALPAAEPGRQGAVQGGAAGRARAWRADADAPLFGVVSRLTAQKGLDLVLAALPALLRRACSSRCRARGDPALEAAFRAAAAAHPGRVAVRIGYDEALRAPADRRRRRDPGAVALRALRADAAVRPALRHAAAGAARRRAGRHRGRRERCGAARTGGPPASSSTPPRPRRCEAALQRAVQALRRSRRPGSA